MGVIINDEPALKVGTNYPFYIHELADHQLLKGEWGEIEYRTLKPPYEIEFRIGPNQSSQSRVIDIIIGGGYIRNYFKLKQPAMSNN